MQASEIKIGEQVYYDSEIVTVKLGPDPKGCIIVEMADGVLEPVEADDLSPLPPAQVERVRTEICGVRISVDRDGDLAMTEGSYTILIVKDQVPEFCDWLNTHYPASPPAPVQGDVEGIAKLISADLFLDGFGNVAKNLAFEYSGDVRIACKWGQLPKADRIANKLREHLPALADGARLMRLAERGVMLGAHRGEWVVSDLNGPHLSRHPDRLSALAAAEQINTSTENR